MKSTKKKKKVFNFKKQTKAFREQKIKIEYKKS